MQTLSLKKISVLGLVLIAASAVTAAIIPSKPNKTSGHVVNDSTDGGVIVNQPTCKTGVALPGQVACNASTAVGVTSTSAAGEHSSDGIHTNGNTTAND